MKKFGFGLMRLPVVNGNYSEVDLPCMTEMVDAFLEAGGILVNIPEKTAEILKRQAPDLSIAS